MKRICTKESILAFFLMLVPLSAYAQNAILQGEIVGSKRKGPVVGAYVKLVNERDTTDIHVASTDKDGKFVFFSLGFKTYILEASSIGYEKLRKTVHVDHSLENIGDLLMSRGVIPLNEVVVEGVMPTAVQKADTTEFLSKAYKTNPDADAGDLLEKMPGITISSSGTVTTNGETVQQILVDGKPFFGGDPTIALRNLPAEAIEKIQVFDKMSDQAEFTGFDDGQSIKTVNFILKREKRNGEFGKTYAGYGDEDKYIAGGSANYLNEDTRVSVIALSNNIDQQNFSTQDLLGVLNTNNQRGGFFAGGVNGRRAGGGGRGGRGGGGGGFGGGGGPAGGIGGGFNFGGSLGNFLVGQQSGITSTNSFGANYSDTWAKGLQLNQSYFFNGTDNNNDQSLNRQYFATQDSINLYNQTSNSENKNYNHRYDARITYSLDSSNSMIDLPRLYFQNNNQTSLLTGQNALTPTQLINQANENNAGSTTGQNLTNHLVLRHRFETPGRTISADLGISYSHKQGSGSLQSLAEYYQGEGNLNDTVDQHSGLLTNTSSLSARVVYTEPVGMYSLLQLNYNPSISYSTSDNRKFNFDPFSQQFTALDTSLTNSYDNTSTAQNAGIGFLVRRSGFNLMANVAYQRSTLQGNQTFPLSNTVERTFYSVLPSMNMNYMISDHSNWRVFFRTSTRSPSINQLQNVVDNSNPLVLTTGNPDLQQSYNSTIVSRYSITDATRAQSFFFLASYQRTDHYIANSTTTAQRDSILTGGVLQQAGTQLVVPVNLDDSWTASTFLTYSLPVTFFKSVLNLSSGFSYAHTPGLVNDFENFSKTSTMTVGSVLSSNISEDVDFTLSYTGNYNIARNTLDQTLNSNYYSHVASLKLNLIFWKGVVFRNEVSNTLTNGLSAGYDQDIVLWNISLGKKFFKDDRGELRLTATDILNQNKNISRTVTDTYIQDTQNNVLRQYVILVFTYTVR